MADQPLPNVIDLTPLNPDFNDDPHRFLDRLRSTCPAHRDEMAGTFILTRYTNVRAILSDTTMWRHPSHAEPAATMSRREMVDGITAAPDEADKSILFLDDPDHARIRTPLAKALYKRVSRSRAQIQGVIDEKLDALAGRTQFDAMDDFALLVPIDVIARILGVDNARLSEFRAWSEGAILSLNPFRTPEQTDRMVTSINAISGYFRELMAQRRISPQDDLISDMVQLQAEGAPLSDGELSNNLQGLLIGGNLTTTDLIGNAVWLLLTHPDQLTRLKADPSLINSAIEEVLRYESPVDVTARIASRELAVEGCPIHTTQAMTLSLRGANRDPEVFAEPHRFDIARKDAPHVAFGGGAHLCIGSPLARLEAQLAIASLIARFPNLHLADPQAKPQWRNLPFFRGLKTLPVVTG
ncbi:MAG: cytochrome P450 [Alphaproteobacteria bacterium]|nr:cytochrome P450 [Alphaproteobacteria bacterium]